MLALGQAERLAQEAKVLIKKKLYSGALSKVILGLEEIGKNRLLLYQASMLQMKKPASWEIFWRIFRSHRDKLKFSLKWFSITNPNLDSKKTLKKYLSSITQNAEHLDNRKQESQYVEFNGVEFANPCDSESQEESMFFLEILDEQCKCLREQYPEETSLEEFCASTFEKIRLSKALGLIDDSNKNTIDDWEDAVVDGNSPVLLNLECLPKIDDFQKRVEEKYKIIPPRLTITLPILNASKQFKEFYDGIKDEYGYPDWVIISAIYNIVLNLRVVSKFKSQPSNAEMASLLDWSEKPEDKPLPVYHFIELESFNFALDIWLLAFLKGLGILVPNVSTENRMKIRRVASRFFPIFEYDVEHWPIFDF